MYHENYTLMENARERMKDFEREAEQYRLAKKARAGRPARRMFDAAHLFNMFRWMKPRQRIQQLDSHKRTTLEMKRLAQ